MTATYDLNKILEHLPWARLAGKIDSSSRALTRVDERLRRSPELAGGFCARAQFFDTCAAMALDGELVHLEDLVLHDAGSDRRHPTHELTRAARLLGLRRRIDRLEFSGSSFWSRPGIFSLIGQRAEEADLARPEVHTEPEGAGGSIEPGEETPAREQEEDLLAELDEVLQRSEHLAQGKIPPQHNRAKHAEQKAGSDLDPRSMDRLDDWLGVVDGIRKTDSLPPVLATALLVDAWNVLTPLDSWPELGRFLAEIFLKAEVTPNHMPMLCVGFRKSPFRWRRQETLGNRLSALLTGFELTGTETFRDLDRLQLARDRLMRRCQTSRRHSRLPEFLDMFLSRPLVTIPMVRQQLGVTAAAVDHMIRQLGPAMPRELTGRSRYRAWGVL